MAASSLNSALDNGLGGGFGFDPLGEPGAAAACGSGAGLAVSGELSAGTDLGPAGANASAEAGGSRFAGDNRGRPGDSGGGGFADAGADAGVSSNRAGFKASASATVNVAFIGK